MNVKKEILNAYKVGVSKYNNLMLATHDLNDAWDKRCQFEFFKLLKESLNGSIENICVYKDNGKELDMSLCPRVVKEKSACVFLDEKDFEWDKNSRFWMSDAYGDTRGTLKISFNGSCESLFPLIGKCYDPSVLANLKTFVNPKAVSKSKKEGEDNKINILFSCSGLDYIFFVGEEDVLLTLLDYSLEKSSFSQGYVSSYCL